MNYDIAFIFIQEPLHWFVPDIYSRVSILILCVPVFYKIYLSKGESSSVLSAMD